MNGWFPNLKHATGLKMAGSFLAAMVMTAVLAQTVLASGPFSIQKDQAMVRAAPPAQESAYQGPCRLVDAGDTWTTSPDVTTQADRAAYVEGPASIRFDIGEGFTTGTAASCPINSRLNAGGDSLTFWIRSSAPLSAGTLRLRLLRSDGLTIDDLAIPGSIPDGNWQKATLSLPGLTDEAAVRAINLYAITDPGALTIWLDSIETASALSTNRFQPGFSGLAYTSDEEATTPG